MPARHPAQTWLHATRVATIRGIGQPTLNLAFPSTEGDQRNLVAYAHYPTWQFDVEFEALPYAVLPDSAVSTYDVTWVDDAGTSTPSKYANEYQRFTSYEVAPSAQVVTANYGQQKFRKLGATPPDGITFPGAPRVSLGSRTLRVTWHFVPYSLTEEANSPIAKYLGRINQKDFYLGNRKYPAGSMLYDKVQIQRSLPPAPEVSVNQFNTASFSHDYTCDVTFFFEVCDRVGEDVPAPSNGNWIAAGWNLRPWFRDGKFYYVTGVSGDNPDADATKWRPTYLSFLVEHLFTDPAIL